MLSEGFPFWTKVFGNIVGWLFNDCVINLHPRITLGSFIVTCAFIGFVIYFLLNSDFFPAPGSFGTGSSSSSSKSKDDSNYIPRHSRGNTMKDYGTRVSRHNYKD